MFCTSPSKKSWLSEKSTNELKLHFEKSSICTGELKELLIFFFFLKHLIYLNKTPHFGFNYSLTSYTAASQGTTNLQHRVSQTAWMNLLPPHSSSCFIFFGSTLSQLSDHPSPVKPYWIQLYSPIVNPLPVEAANPEPCSCIII